MSQLNFDIYKLTQPKSVDDYAALLDEALLILGDISESLESLISLAENLQEA